MAIKIGDVVLRRKSIWNSHDDVWVETVVNETYLKLICEFPEDYKFP